MFEQFLVRKDSLQNVTEDGKVVGFSFAVKIADYRGVFLSLHNGYYIDLDGTVYEREKQKLEVNGQPPRTLEEIKKCCWEHWNYGDEIIVHVEKEGGLTPGKHVLRLQQSVLNSYGYIPPLEEWVENPPVPGSGAGAGKTLVICEYELELQEG